MTTKTIPDTSDSGAACRPAAGSGCRELIEDIRRRQPPVCTLLLRFDGCVIEVRLSDPELQRILARYFSPFVVAGQHPDMVITVHESSETFPLPYRIKQPDPGKTKIKEEYFDFADGRVVRKRLTGMHFFFGGDQHLAIGPCRANSNQVVNFINNRFIQWKLQQGWLLGHAAGVCMHGRGLALAGFSGMGKSTLALHIMSRGATFVSNDRLLVTATAQDCRMAGVAKLPRVNPGTVLNNPDLAPVIPAGQRSAFADLPAAALWDLEHKFDVDIEQCFGPDRFVLEAGMHSLVILNWRRSQEPFHMARVDIRRRRDLLAAFTKETGLFYLPAGGSSGFTEDQYLDILARIRVFELWGGVDFQGAADACVANCLS